ncbi:ABC transporter ATP-binding protein (plasmid) [Azospirillum brasilense]|uniref:ABC transporter ATP-binding protein n=1 Tax=Azospirillum brasilense TaxID=192 RepID=A0A4D8QQ45_AZOBR|nr:MULTISPECIES: ABC transporter ATP-binding protein [Azospirillum]MDW7554521.1 ABC transporter ATP-binding protein [Azospirillum brasilense]MDW7593960.1 ABC transporter ATP-binding protein [Azospirillum brasilense]MDW7632062.1 ABC transporter ATP-binding protein [Azospirillum brasilense]MDX5950070.1 ABC transporter ATP-binding protein [Azospirillum brasilense]PWC86753.1 peptide ABC transporter substrate-binding protein [Azospirillum sp. Sp 7]
MTPILEVEGLCVDIPTPAGTLHAVRDVSFRVGKGEILCIVGESGCGKSLTSLALMDLLPGRARREARRLSFAGTDLGTLSPRAMRNLRGNRMAMIFQEPMTSLNPAFTIGNQMAEALRCHTRASAAEARERAAELLALVGVPAGRDRLNQYPHQLSGGLRQRVMIAMALMGSPDLLIADEPTTALDVTIQAQILHLLEDLRDRTGLSIVLITHDLGVVAQLADRVVVMYAGSVVEEGPVDEVFGRPAHPYTRGLLDCVPVPGRTPPGSLLGSIPGVVPSLIGAIPGCPFAARCSFAADACLTRQPPLRPAPLQPAGAGAGHSFRCVLEGSA